MSRGRQREARAAVSAGNGAYGPSPEHSDAWTLAHRRKLPATAWISVPPRRQHEMVDVEKPQDEVHKCGDSKRDVRADRNLHYAFDQGVPPGQKVRVYDRRTPNASGVEQTAVVVRVVDEQLTPEMFLEWHATAKQDSLTLVKLQEDSLLRFGMNFAENCVGQALDGAFAMVDRLSGVKTRIKAKYPRAQFIYCAGNALNLVIRHAIDDIPAYKPSMAVVGSIARHVKCSKGWIEFQ